jgi:hypothetical protein
MAAVDEQKQIERAVLEEVLELHPDHLTPTELVLKMSAGPDRSEGEAIEHAIRDLSGSGLLRYVGEVIAPTYAALRVAALVIWC